MTYLSAGFTATCGHGYAHAFLEDAWVCRDCWQGIRAFVYQATGVVLVLNGTDDEDVKVPATNSLTGEDYHKPGCWINSEAAWCNCPQGEWYKNGGDKVTSDASEPNIFPSAQWVERKQPKCGECMTAYDIIAFDEESDYANSDRDEVQEAYAHIEGHDA